MRIALGLQYDGAAFSGWQSQPHGNTVQDVLEHALSRFTRTPVSVTVAGRTDAGVHALGQVAHFDTPLSREDFSWVRGVNAFLPASVAVQWARPVPETFHARFGAFERVYHYALCSHPVRQPLLVGRAGWIYAPLNVAAMQSAAALLVGKHDFSAFRSSECQARSPIKVMYGLDLVSSGRFFVFEFRANAFLHHMVRNIMGCLIMVGRGRQTPAWLAEVLASRDRRLAAPTFMPDGLYLSRVVYPAEFAIPEPTPGPWPFAENH
ncbi:MAG: tRNA pseudouridine(38-40) synthase TruA [Janthinobacterium lividum]